MCPRILGSLLLIANLTWALPASRLDQAIQLYDSARFAEARRTLDAIVVDPSTSPTQLTQAQLYLAATLLATHEKAAARAVLTLALRDKPASFVLDPVSFPPELIALAEDVRAELAHPSRAAHTPLEPEPHKSDAKVEMAPVAKIGASEVPSTVVSQGASEEGVRRFWWAPTALGATAAVGGVLFFVWGKADYRRLNSASQLSDTEAKSLRDGGSAKESAGVALMAGGATLAAAGLAMFFLWPAKSSHVAVFPISSGAAIALQGELP